MRVPGVTRGTSRDDFADACSAVFGARVGVSGHKNKFERGKVDIFKVAAPDVGRIRKIRIGHNGRGVGSGWFVDKIEITAAALGKKYTFVASRWLATNEGDGKLECEVAAKEGDLEQFDPESSFTFRTFTSDKSGATLETATAYVEIHGAERSSKRFKLRNGSKCFNKRGKMDEFSLEVVSLGEVQKIVVGHDNAGLLGSTWHLERVELHDLKKDVLYKFAANCEVSKKAGNPQELL